jgi:glycosyltransferase involved in cell wall biosynthesis
VKSPKISAVLATYNEEENIFDCINSLKQFADEIVVVDGNSSDRTAEIAAKMNAKVITTTNKKMFHTNKNMAIDAAKNPWIFLVDADERVSESLANEIKEKITASPKEEGFYVPRRNWFLGGFLKKGGAYPDSVIRLFKKGKGRLPEITVHEQVEIEGKVGKLKNDILHLADPSFSRYILRANRYTDETAAKLEKENPGRKTTDLIYYCLIKPAFTFFKIYIRHRGYADGFRGFVWAFFSSAHYFFAYVKYFKKG